MESNTKPDAAPNAQQAMHDAMVTAARGIIFGSADNDQGFKATLQKLASGHDQIAQTIGHTAAMVLTSVKGGIEQKGRQVPSDPAFLVGVTSEIVQDLIDIADAAKIIPKGQDKAAAKQALFESMKVFGEGELGKKAPPAPQPGAPVPAAPAPAPGIVQQGMGAPA